MTVIDIDCPECWQKAGHHCRSPLGYTCAPHEARLAAKISDDSKSIGYHTKHIDRGTYGELSKIIEEFDEFRDAISQGVLVMAFCELADLFGAIQGWLENYHPTVKLEDILAMKSVTTRAFKNGHRSPK